MKKLFILLSFVLITQSLLAQKSKVQSGPMVAGTEMREAKLWIQTTGSADVKFRYREAGKNTTFFETQTVKTNSLSAFTALLIADNVEPGRMYEYEVYLNGVKQKFSYPLTFMTPPLWQWRGDAPDLTFATGSCAYVNEEVYDRPGKPYGGNYEIFTEIYKTQPAFFLWLGDNIYLREADWNTRTGILKRYTHTRSLPELQPMLANMANFATWDDHDFGPNDSDRGFPFKSVTLEGFKLFWGNPYYGFNGKDAVTTSFQWSDCDFFLLDDRSFRTPDFRKTGAREMFGEEQINWLIDQLVSSQATFKFVVAGGQLINTSTKFEAYGMFPEEREKFLSLIEKEKIPGVIFITGDIHSSEISKLERKGTYTLYDITVSPLTSGVHIGAKDDNPFRIDESSVKARNFAQFNVSGKKGDRLLTVKFIDNTGKERYTFKLNQKDLK